VPENIRRIYGAVRRKKFESKPLSNSLLVRITSEPVIRGKGVKMNQNIEAAAALSAFPTEGTLIGVLPYGSGHINDTYAAYYQLESGECRRYLLQRINSRIFRDVDGLMRNIAGVTGYLADQIRENGGNPRREALTLITPRDGGLYFTDPQDMCWRMYEFIENTFSVQIVENPEDMYHSGLSFGNFQRLLADYPAQSLTESIPDFHNTPKRYEAFLEAVEKDVLGRAAGVEKEITFVKSRAADARALTSLLESGELALRVSHNDTKINNILFDKATGMGLCVIDLDTVMPGLYHYDFGDAIRSGANSAAEDEPDVNKVEIRLDLFEAFTKGYLEAVGSVLSKKEKELLPMSAKLMTLECGIRFLTDYLAGDSYFKIHRPGHNLDRARTQFKMVADMEAKWSQMQLIVRSFT
jgi:hypothetical protein